MNIFLKYLSDRVVFLLFLLGLFLVNIIIDFLYRVSLERTILWLLLCSFVGAILMVVDYFHYRKKYLALNKLKEKVHLLSTIPLPATRNKVEKGYSELISKLAALLVKNETASLANEQSILEYFTIWVHQIKIPISALYLILQDQEVDDKSNEEMKTQLFEVEKYVESVLQYIRLESSTTDYIFQETDLDDILVETIKKYALFFIRKKLQLHYTKVDYQLITDSKWLSFVIEQILSNALKYTEQGSISVYMEDPDRLVIEDTGIGINSEDIPRIGEKNFTGFVGRQHKSATGIGLYLSKKILAKLGHSLRIESEPDKGTKVLIQFNSPK
ncbi:sensor histidine kinase [Facklamia lactis]|uniref:sensor histidine kinase n=1 Tax=Facklamia lactis TaxID=2749967 RepID=UPI0018CF2750|nr:sensor histidine kinase [Facklamia lactis]MBG9979539.1 sensor histidine kinase [Facklamia lactis]